MASAADAPGWLAADPIAQRCRHLDDDAQAAIAERAAIFEHDVGMPRDRAEDRAVIEHARRPTRARVDTAV